jgi:hypothetical protein
MKYAVETGSHAMIDIPIFIKIWFRHLKQNMMFPYAHFHFFQNKESKLIRMVIGMMVQQYADPARLIYWATIKEILSTF